MPSNSISLRFFLHVQGNFIFLHEQTHFFRNVCEIDGITKDGGIALHPHVSLNFPIWVMAETKKPPPWHTPKGRGLKKKPKKHNYLKRTLFTALEHQFLSGTGSSLSLMQVTTMDLSSFVRMACSTRIFLLLCFISKAKSRALLP